MACEESQVRRARRYYLLKRLEARELGDDGLALVWRGKQEAEPGTPLPADFPSLAHLETAGYTTVEDLDGAGTRELRDTGLTANQATAVLAAIEPLL